MEVSINNLIGALTNLRDKYGNDVTILIGKKGEVNGNECTIFPEGEHYLVGEGNVNGCDEILFKIKSSPYDGNEDYNLGCLIAEKE